MSTCLERELSLIGRIHIIKSLAGSQLTYCWSTINTPPESFTKQVNSIIYEFLWNSTVDRIKRDTIIAPYDCGGLKMLDIISQEKALKIKWISTIQREATNPGCMDIWVKWIMLNIPCKDTEYFLKCNFNKKDMSKVLTFPNNSFWRDVFKHWCELNFDRYPLGDSEI